MQGTTAELSSGYYRNKLLKNFSFILAGIGLVISAYLFWQHYLLINEANINTDICYKVFGRGCTRALGSRVATQFGLPLAGWGIIYYSVFIAVLCLPLKNSKPVIFILSLVACIASLSLVVMIYFDHALFCPFCLLIHIINWLLFFISAKFIYDKGFFSSPYKQLNAALKFNSFKIKVGAGFILPVIFLYFIMHIVLTTDKIIFDTQKFIKGFYNSPQQIIMIDKDDHVIDAANNPVQVIVFSDFECPACRRFSQVITMLQKKYPGKLSVVFKNYPLGKKCNPIFWDYDLHPKACEAAAAAEAAALQQKFFQYHDLLFAADLEKTNETFLSLAVKAGLNISQFEKDRNSTIVNSRVSKTIHQGYALGIKGTPAVFVNGHAVNDFRLRHMQVLIEHIIYH